MSRLAKFLKLPPGDKLLLTQALLLVVAVRLGLRLVLFKTLLGLLARLAPEVPDSQEVDPEAVVKVAWALAVAKRYVPGVTTCLAEALSAMVLLSRRGQPAQLRIGVDRGDGGRFQAHAWVECQGRVVVGGDESHLYTPFPALELKRS